MAVSWSGQEVCRVYSLHKKFAFIDAFTDGYAIQTLSFDQYGQFLAIGTTNNMTITAFKKWQKKLTIL